MFLVVVMLRWRFHGDDFGGDGGGGGGGGG